MTMNKTTVFVLIGAFISALLVALIVSALVSKEPAKMEEVKKIPMVEILLAAKNIPIGNTLTDNSVRWQEWPEDKVFPNAIIKGKPDAKDVIGKKLRRAMLKDEPITPSALIPEAKGGFMAAALEPGMRAVSIEVDADTSVAGFVTPGDYVDVLVNYALKVRSNNPQALQREAVKAISETILSSIRVLAVDQSSDTIDGTKVSVGKTITLEVTPQQAEKLLTADSMGKIQLALRKMGEKDVYQSSGTADVNASNALNRIVRSISGSAAADGTARIYSGAGVEEVPMRGNVIKFSKTPQPEQGSEGGEMQEGSDE